MSTAQNGVVNQRMECASVAINTTGTTEVYAGGGVLKAIEMTGAVTNASTASAGAILTLISGSATLAEAGVALAASSADFGEIMAIGNLTIPIPSAVNLVVSTMVGFGQAHGNVGVNLTLADN